MSGRPIEETTGPGRPEVGPAFTVRLPADLTARLDERAKADGASRAEMIRQAVTRMLDSVECVPHGAALTAHAEIFDGVVLILDRDGNVVDRRTVADDGWAEDDDLNPKADVALGKDYRRVGAWIEEPNGTYTATVIDVS